MVVEEIFVRRILQSVLEEHTAHESADFCRQEQSILSLELIPKYYEQQSEPLACVSWKWANSVLAKLTASTAFTPLTSIST